MAVTGECGSLREVGLLRKSEVEYVSGAKGGRKPFATIWPTHNADLLTLLQHHHQHLIVPQHSSAYP